MALWQLTLIALLVLILGAIAAFVIWLRRAALTPAEAARELKSSGSTSPG